MSNNNETWRQPPPFRDPRIKENDDLQEGDAFNYGCFWVMVYRSRHLMLASYEKFSSREAAERAISRAVYRGEFTAKDEVWPCQIVL